MRVCRLYFEDLISQEEDLEFFAPATMITKLFNTCQQPKTVCG